jgi:3-deoxy-7-phosphoheptulonate synthase
MWNVDSWKDFVAKQQPKYENIDELSLIENEIKKMPRIVDFESIKSLRQNLSEVESGDKILFQAGDCAESFDDFSEDLLDRFKAMMVDCYEIVARRFNKKCLLIGRIAGQFAKPRSNDFEKIDGEDVAVYRGDIVNGSEKNLRNPDPKRMLQAYNYSVSGVNYLSQINHNNRIYTSHECLLLDYESSLVKKNNEGIYFNSSAHMLWIGNRTRGLNDAHIEFLRGIYNPIGIKIDEKISASEIAEIVKRLNPNNESGKIILISRMGSSKIEQYLPQLLDEWKKLNLKAIWCVDPMHGNGENCGNFKTRNVANIFNEVNSFVKIVNSKEINFFGFHFEATPNDVSECFSDNEKMESVDKNEIGKNYQTKCDPRLNKKQLLQILKEIDV